TAITPRLAGKEFTSDLFANLPTTAGGPVGADAQPKSVAAPPTAAPAAPRSVPMSASVFVAERAAPQVVLNAINASVAMEAPRVRENLAQLEILVPTGPAREALEVLKASSLTPDARTHIKNALDFVEAAVPNYNRVTANQVRTLNFERLKPALAPEVRTDLFNAKLEIFDQLLQLDLSLAGLTTDFVDKPDETSSPAIFNFHFLVMHRAPDTLAPNDEGKHFEYSVKHADMSIAALRAVETRIKLYRDLIALCRKNLALIEADQARLRQRLKVVDDELAEARQDVAVAQALLDEETDRVNALNDHREQVLREHTGFLVFHRPRAIEARDETPVCVIEPALRIAPVPACLEEDLPLPPDFQALAEVFRHSPAGWFKYAPRWIETLDRLDPLRDLLTRASQSVTINRVAPAASSGRFNLAINHVLIARATVSANFALAVHALDPAQFTTWSWSDLRRRAEETLTLGHLIDAGPAQLAQQASKELHDLFKVGACLHRDFSQVEPFLRLLWAERYGEFDGPADFRDLSRLPRWSNVRFALRREMQIHADWLYSRVDAARPEALELIHDLIRVGLLLASHAPVDQLITGSVAEETTPTTGELIKLTVDPLRVRIGMEVLVHQDNNPLVRAVVEDIGTSQVSARVTAVPVAAKLRPEAATVRFQLRTPQFRR
ncbi:MAG TPA: hypothetical protein VI454_18865, partial [Verrucomicrobiae bacterium]